MIAMTLAEVAAATGGRLAGGARPETGVTGPVVIDSREVGPGGLFVALVGERVDGHDYAAAAMAAGAAAVLSDRDLEVACVVVDDVRAGLGALARAVRDRLDGLTVIGVTGSSGKTSTKDLLAQLLADAGPTVAPPNSFNNEIGVPLTLLRCEADTRFLVSEMGAREPGNITYLCDIVRPRIGVVLNVGAAHAGVFGSREATAAAKGELVEALPAASDGGLAVLNADDAAVAAMASRSPAAVVRTGVQALDAEVRASAIGVDSSARPSFTLHLGGVQVPVRLPLHGEHHVANALAAAAVAAAVGLPPSRIGALLSRAAQTSAGRMSVTERADGLLVVDDAYNANPDSMAAALRALAVMARRGGRTWAVLGEMLELGPDGDAEHARIAALAERLGVDHLVAVGPGGHAYGRPSGPTTTELIRAGDVDAALAVLRDRVRPPDVVLVKASNAIGLARLAAALRESPDDAVLPRSEPTTGEDGGGVGARSTARVQADEPREVGA
jgi:UDP-N-acetylmuramoyl-tripeptide--D-alanyl-D-alanine ligase